MKKALFMIFAVVLCVAFLVTAQADFNLTYYNVRFTGSYAVYTGPGTNYLRANGNATYGGGVARYYGTAPNGWLMIGYETSGGLWRMGYIEPAAALKITTSPSDYALFDFFFTSVSGQVTYNTFITDDPLYGDKTPLVNVLTGQQVTVLGVWDAYWMYVEAQVNGHLLRGYIKSDAVDTSGVPIPTPVPTPVPTYHPTPTPVPTYYPTPTPIVTGTPYLSSLTNNAPNTGIMLPGSFSPMQTSYLLTVASWVSSVNFVPYSPTPGVAIYCNGQYVANGSQTQSIALSNNPASATFTLVGSNAKTNTYTVYIQRRPSDKRTRVSAGYIDSVYSNGAKNFIRADLVTVTYTAGTNLSTFNNDTYYIYDYACAGNCVFYYGSMFYPNRAINFSDFVAHYKNYGSTLYRFVYIEDEIVAVMPYNSDYASP